MPALDIQLFHLGRWHTAAIFSVDDTTCGHAGVANLDYHLDYAAEHLNNSDPRAALSCRFPINFARYSAERWPAFILDMMPSGAGRDKWLARRGLSDSLAADWELLSFGAGSPPGNLRVREAVVDHRAIIGPDAEGNSIEGLSHPGFSREDILQRGEHFIEYAYQHGALTAGASDVQGEAPKFLLVEDHNGRWHAEGAIDDSRVAKHWLLKFPRGNTAGDRQILRNETAYLEVARQLHFVVGDALLHREDALFIPRFDRSVSDNKVERYGLESLCSAAGISEYGASPPHELLVKTLASCSQQPAEDVAEYICRDVLNVVLGNKDNHARNTALLKGADIRLSPIYDFAPMYLDAAGIARVCRWQGEREQAGKPNWKAIVDFVAENYGADYERVLRQRLSELSITLLDIENIMCECGIDTDIIHARQQSITANLQLLQEL